MSEPTDPPATTQLIEELTRERDDLRSELRRLIAAVGAWRVDDTPAHRAELDAALRAARASAAEG